MKPIMRFYNAIIAAYKDRISISLPALLLFLATFTLAGAANAAPLTYVASAKGVNTATLPSHQAGDILIAWAIRDNANASPVVPTGWTTIRSEYASNLGYALAWKTATSSNELVGTFSNATSLIVSQYRPGDGYTVSIGANSTKASSNTLTATYMPLTLQNTDGSSWALAFYGHRSSDIGGLSAAPTGMVNRSFDQDAVDSVAVHSTPAGVSTWTSKSVAYTGTLSAYRTVVLELKLTPPTGGGLSWQLDEGHYEPRVADMAVVHPRPDNEGGDNSHAQHRNAYPGIPWSTHIDVMGGSYPFRFELTGNVPAGMTIGSELTQVGDVLQASSNYGVISWPNPVAGVYTISARVYDQEYQRGSSPTTYEPVEFTLTVSTARFVFINPNPEVGHDSNPGTINAPFRTTYPLHNGSSSTSTYSGRNVYLLGGTHDLKGMSTNNLNYAMFPGAAPNVFIGYPGQTAVLNLNEGWFVGWGGTDFMLKDLTIQHASIWRNDQRFYWAIARQLRNSFHNVVFRNYMMGLNTQNDNPALTYFGGLEGQYHNYISFKHCEFTGSMGNISTTYATRNFSFQHNRIHNINTAGNYSSNNNHGLLYFKHRNQNIEVRANSAWENISAYEMYSFAGIGSYNAMANTYAYHDIRYSFNKVAGFNQALYGLFEGGDPLPGSVFGFRNSTLDRIADGVTISPPVLNQWTNNVVAEGFHNMQGNFVESGNVLGTTVLDSQVRLTGAYRTQSLGQVGAEIR